MKTKNALFFLFFIGVCGFAKSQSTSGVFLSYEDFRNQKMMYVIDCSTEKHKIKLNDFLGKDYITVVHEKQTHNLKKKDIFGYKDCDNITYRFVANDHYVILNPTEEILLYKYEMLSSKGNDGVLRYYFSYGGGVVQDLTLANLKKAFPDNHKFHDALDAEFKSDSELVSYDSFHKTYKINRLYANSIGQ